MLLQAGANATVVGSQGTAEQVATQAGHNDIAKMLLGLSFAMIYELLQS